MKRVDGDLLESVCNESHTSLEHWVGKLSDEKSIEVRVAPEILAKYVGTYEEQDFWGNRPHPAMIEITVSGGALFAELKGREKVRLAAQVGHQFCWLLRSGNPVCHGRARNGDASPGETYIEGLQVPTRAIALNRPRLN